jgi:aarF domain-containing kinase
MVVLVPASYVSTSAHQWSWQYALWGIEQAGPTFLKLVQWATTRQDLFSPEFCNYFGKLRDQTVGHAWKDTEKILLEDLGDAAALFDLQPEPVGSGCIAQVYRGTLKKAAGQYPAGTDVAVKVQHPGIWQMVCVDFYILGKCAKMLEDLPYLNLRYLALTDTVRQFRDMMLPQLDLTLEAKHLNRFNRDFAGDETISFPYPLAGLTTPRVLTETFVEGTPIMEYLTAPPRVRKELAMMGLDATLRMIFLNDFLHGDLHPGNILVGEIPGKPGKLQLHLLDCGLVVEMGPQQHVNLTKILGAFTRKNGRLAGQLMVDMSSKVQASGMDMELFITGIENIVESDKDNNFLEKVGDYITDICYLACRHKVKLEASFINAALAVEIMEGIATQLSPDLVVTSVALPLVVQAELMHRLPKFSLW